MTTHKISIIILFIITVLLNTGCWYEWRGDALYACRKETINGQERTYCSDTGWRSYTTKPW